MSTFNLFERCTAELVSQLRELGNESIEDRGTCLLREGIASDQLFIVIDGELGVVTQSARKSSEELSTLTQGALAGEMSWLEKRPPVATVEVHSRSTLLSIPRAKLDEKVKNEPGFASQFYRLIAEKLALQIKEQNTWIHRFNQDIGAIEPLRKILILFAGLDERDVHRLANLGQRHRLSPGDILLRENDPVPSLYIVMAGEADISVSIAGKDQPVGSSRRGEVLGEMTFLLPEQHKASASIQARSGLDLLAIDRLQLTQMLDSDPGLSSRFYRGLACMLSQRSRDQLLSHQLADLSRQAETELDQLDLEQLEGASRAARYFDWLCHQARDRQEFTS